MTQTNNRQMRLPRTSKAITQISVRRARSCTPRKVSRAPSSLVEATASMACATASPMTPNSWLDTRWRACSRPPARACCSTCATFCR